MFHKKELKKQIFALVIAAAMVCQTQAVSASVVSLQAGAQNALTAPSLQMAETARSTDDFRRWHAAGRDRS